MVLAQEDDESCALDALRLSLKAARRFPLPSSLFPLRHRLALDVRGTVMHCRAVTPQAKRLQRVLGDESAMLTDDHHRWYGRSTVVIARASLLDFDS